MAHEPRLEGVDFAPRPPSGDFSIRKIYVKDLSFETPHSPAIFTTQWQPDADVNLRTSVSPLEPGDYEVTLSITATMKVGEQTAFLAEVQQAGIFRIVGATDEQMRPTLGSACPGILFPYAREAVSDVTTRGGFPQFLLAPVNFDALYLRSLQEGQQQAAAAADGGDGQD